MIVLDTNVLSEALKPTPAETVLRWLAAQDPTAVFTTAITQAEVLYGVEVLPSGRHRAKLSSAIERLFANEFRGRVLPFDEGAARLFPRHAQIGGSWAARNVADFEHCGIPIIDPWN